MSSPYLCVRCLSCNHLFPLACYDGSGFPLILGLADSCKPSHVVPLQKCSPWHGCRCVESAVSCFFCTTFSGQGLMRSMRVRISRPRNKLQGVWLVVDGLVVGRLVRHLSRQLLMRCVIEIDYAAWPSWHL